MINYSKSNGSEKEKSDTIKFIIRHIRHDKLIISRYMLKYFSVRIGALNGK
jgi:hypothetical protein